MDKTGEREEGKMNAITRIILIFIFTLGSFSIFADAIKKNYNIDNLNSR